MQNLIKKFLQKNNYYSQKKDFEDYFTSHPNYPSLYAATDTLTLIGVDNVAAKIPQDQFLDLPDSFLSIYKDELILIEKTPKEVMISKDNGTTEKLSIDIFLKDWNGVIVAISKNEVIHSFDRKSFKKEILFFALTLFFIMSGIVNNNLNLITVIGFTILMIGLFLSVLIVKEKYEEESDNSFTSKICSFNEKMSCNNVIKSNQTKFFKSLDFSDLPIVFFSTAITLSIINPNFIAVVGFLCLLSIPIVVYSIWIQKVVLKKWCLLCLSISVVITTTTFFSLDFISNPNWKSLFYLIVVLSAVSSVWLNYRNLLKSNSDLNENNNQLLSFKRNPTVFNLLSKPIQFKEVFHSFQKVDYGSTSNAIHLSIILSPSCGHCHKAFEDALELLSNYPDKFKLSIFFNVNPENYNNPYLNIAYNIVQIINKNSNDIAKDALHDWHIKRMSQEQWMEKWNQGDIETSVIKELQLQFNWCQDNGFNYTPVKLVNDNFYPHEYTISELRYFASHLEEELIKV